MSNHLYLVLTGCLGGTVLGTGVGLVTVINRLAAAQLSVPSSLIVGAVVAFGFGFALIGYTVRRYLVIRGSLRKGAG